MRDFENQDTKMSQESLAVVLEINDVLGKHAPPVRFSFAFPGLPPRIPYVWVYGLQSFLLRTQARRDTRESPSLNRVFRGLLLARSGDQRAVAAYTLNLIAAQHMTALGTTSPWLFGVVALLLLALRALPYAAINALLEGEYGPLQEDFSIYKKIDRWMASRRLKASFI